MAWDLYNVQRWKPKVGFHNRGVQWDTPVARWAGEGRDWITLMTQLQPRREDVIRSLLESTKQAVEKKAELNGTRPTRKPRDLPPLELELGIPVAGKRPTLEIKGDCKTIVDWINGHATLKTRERTVAKTQNHLRDWWGRGVHLRYSTAEWSTHIFREHNKEADFWAEKSAKGQVDEWVETAHVVWSEDIGLCRFWDGCCDNRTCGARIMILARKYWAGSLSARNAGRWWVRIRGMLSWVAAVC